MGTIDGRQVVTVYLKHFNNPERQPQPAQCSDDPEKGRKGCGGSIVFYWTHPGEKRMPFDGEPVVHQQFPVRQDGAVLAQVFTDNVHFATCTARRRPGPPPPDWKSAAGGGPR